MSDKPTHLYPPTMPPTVAELRRAASEWCAVTGRGPAYYRWFVENWTLPELKPFVDREMLERADTR